MARIKPFQPYRMPRGGQNRQSGHTALRQDLTGNAGALSWSIPYNLVRVILGERFDGDTDANNVYTRSAQFFNEWIEKGILQKEAEPSVYAYFQEFDIPDTGERLIRKGFIALGAVEDYEARVVHRHEQTLSGPRRIAARCWNTRARTLDKFSCCFPTPRAEWMPFSTRPRRSSPPAA